MKYPRIIYILVIGIIYSFNNDNNGSRNYVLIDKLHDSTTWKISHNSYLDSFFSQSNCTYLRNTRFRSIFYKDFTVRLNDRIVRLHAYKLDLENDSVCGRFFYNLKLAFLHDTIRGRPYDYYCLESKMITWEINIRDKNVVYLVSLYDRVDYYKKEMEILTTARNEFGDENVFH